MRPFVLFFTCVLFINLQAQELTGKVQHATAILFRGNMYVGGYDVSAQGLEFRLACYDPDLQKIKEVSKGLGKQKSGAFYAPKFDTTHGYLSVEIQKADLYEKRVMLLRYDEDLRQVSYAESIEMVRINSFAAFNNEKIYFKNQLYMVREAKDSLGRFYFFRYDLKDSSAAFTYDLKWQFNFDQHTYHRIHPLYVKDDKVYLYVICLDGDKKGQWILILDTGNGDLTRAVKLNKNDNEFCVLSRFDVYGGNSDMAMAGMIYPSANIDINTGKFSVNYQGAKAVNAFFCFLDSAGNMSTRLTNFMNVPNDVLKEKEHKEMLFRCNQLERSGDGFKLNYECLYGGKDGVYRTYGFLLCKLSQTPEGTFKAENNAFLSCYHNEKKNPFCRQMANQYLVDAIGSGDRIFFREPMLRNYTPMGMEMSALKKMAWNIGYFENKKTNHLELIKNTMKNYAWETSQLKTIGEYGRAAVFHWHLNRFFLFYTSKDESGFQMSLIDL